MMNQRSAYRTCRLREFPIEVALFGSGGVAKQYQRDERRLSLPARNRRSPGSHHNLICQLPHAKHLFEYTPCVAFVSELSRLLPDIGGYFSNHESFTVNFYSKLSSKV